MRIILAAATIVLAATACGGSMFIKERPAQEKLTSTPGSKFRSLATLAASGEAHQRRMATNLRADLNNAGVRTIASAGRWDTERQAWEEICTKAAEPVDGIVMVGYQEVSVIDCETKQTAYSIDGDPAEGGPGIREMTKRLIQYLRGTEVTER